jgi:hypothetical protein
MAAVAGAQPPGGSPPGGGPPPQSYTGPVPPTRKCSKRQCTHMHEAPINLKADGSNNYSQCWRCRGATSRSATKRRKLDSITTGSLIEPTSSSSPSINQFASMRRQLAQAQSMASLRGAPTSGQFALLRLNSPLLHLGSPLPQVSLLLPRLKPRLQALQGLALHCPTSMCRCLMRLKSLSLHHVLPSVLHLLHMSSLLLQLGHLLLATMRHSSRVGRTAATYQRQQQLRGSVTSLNGIIADANGVERMCP